MEKEQSEFYKLTPENQRKEPWFRCAEAHFNTGPRMTAHQVDSYNKFVSEKLGGIITNTTMEFTKDDKQWVGTFQDVFVKKPEHTEASGIASKLYPADCRLRNLSYLCKIYCTIICYRIGDTNKIEDTNTYPEVYLGSLPCMVFSNYCNLAHKDEAGLIKHYECPRDPGGYFIIKGNEKVLMSQDRAAHNEIFVFKGKKKQDIKIGGHNIPCDWYGEVRSYNDSCEPNITTTTVKLGSSQLDKGEDQRLYVDLPGFNTPIPWPIIFMALGVEHQSDMIKIVCEKTDKEMIDLLTPSLDCPQISSQAEALAYLAKLHNNNLSEVKKILRNKMFQNIDYSLKVFYLGQMTTQILATALGRRTADDRDHYAKKRVETAGNLITNLFKSVWKRIIREAKNTMKKRCNDVDKIFTNKITGYILPPFATGEWNGTKSATKATKAGISQLLNRQNYVSTVSNLRRVITPSEKNSKIIKPRHLHSSQWGFLCPCETPEGQSAGLIRNLAMFTQISLGSSERPIFDWLKILAKKQLCSFIDKKSGATDSKYKIYLNGSWIGFTECPEKLVTKLRSLRRTGKIEYDTSISYSTEGLRIYTDDGRMLAPFFVIKDGRIKNIPDHFVTWSDLIEKGIIEYLDPAELETVKHSEYPWKINDDDTHSLIHPCFLLGISVSTSPFSDHNQSPRNIYQAAMGKQALGVFAKNFLHRFDTSSHILCYPQRPLVNTATMRLTKSEELPSGQNLIVAIMSGGYNQEDSVMINQRAIDNGALRSLNYWTHCESYYRKGPVTEEIKCPEKSQVKETRTRGYSRLDPDGMPKEHTPLAKRDVVIGKVNSNAGTVRDVSVIVKPNGMEENAISELVVDGATVLAVNQLGSAFVDKTVLTTNEESYKTTKVRVCQTRIPQIGDKFASRHAQKGIAGLIVSPQDMPYSKQTGMSPDLLMNPNAIPSRMTIGQILECMLGKACSLNGSFGDATPFDAKFDRAIVCRELTRFGFEECGDEVMINGMTGEEMPCKIFIGPTYYQRLKHMVDDKIHARDQDGPRQTLTRQPVEGRKYGGGFKMGEMETWCGISHGVSNFLIERLVDNSDAYEMYVCDYCGNTAIATLKTQHFECKFCQQDTAISKIRFSYAFKLLQQYLQACGLGVWINVDTTKTLTASTNPSR